MSTTLQFQQARARLFNRPLLLTPAKARDLVGVLAPRAGLAGRLVDAGQGAVVDLDALLPEAMDARDDRKPYPVADGVAVIEVVGTLVAKLGTMDPWSGMTGYDGLIAKLDAATVDPDVRGILLDIESPGGEVHSSLDECVVAIREAAAAKPVWAVCSDYAASAAYWLAAQADYVVVPPTGEVGSVGVVCLHADFSRALDKDGVTVTLIHGGAHKVDGNPYEPLPEDVRANIQRDVDTIWSRFVGAVAEARGLAADAVKATEARCFMGQAAVDVGFADAVLTPDEAFNAFLQELSSEAMGASAAAASAATQGKHKEMSMPNKRVAAAPTAARSTRRGRRAMDNPNDPNDPNNPDDQQEGAEDNPNEPTQPSQPSEPAAAPGDGADPNDPNDPNEPDETDDPNQDDQPADGSPAAREERRRVASILEAPEAKGREQLANHLALHTSMSPAQARKALKAAPKGGTLDAAMDKVGNATVGTGSSATKPKNHGWNRAVEKVCGSVRKAG